MDALRYTLFVVHAVFLLLAGILIGSSFAGFLGSGYAIASALCVIVLWGVFAGLTIYALRLAIGANDNGSMTQAMMWAKWLFFVVTLLSPVTGFVFAFGAFVGCGPLWLPSVYQWGGVTGTILGLAAFFLLPVLVGACVDDSNAYGTHNPWWWVVSVAPLLVVVVWGSVWLYYYSQLKGDVNVSDYMAKDHIYQLPFPGGESSWVIQGNNSSYDHNNEHFGQKFSWDFRRECGTPVLAARAGKINPLPDDTHDGFGTSAPNNQIMVDHGDGTVAYYLHIQKGSVPTRFRTLNAKVNKGDEIAEVGCVGLSLTGHIHFMVRPTGATCTGNAATSTKCTTIGVSFTDVSDDNGIPRTFGSYTSGNRKVP